MSEEEAVSPLEEGTCRQFWDKLASEQERLSALSLVEAMEQVNEWLSPFSPELAAEISGSESGLRELIFTAHGSTSQFGNLQRLVGAAPTMERFTASAFRRRCAPGGFAMRMDGFELGFPDVLVTHVAEGGQVALEIGFARPIPMDLQDHARHMAFIMLDHALGEFDFAVKVGPVDFMQGEAAGVPLNQFVDRFDAFWNGPMGRTGVFPQGEHSWSAMTLSMNETGEELLVQRNNSANALVGRADLGYCLQVQVPARDEGELELARAFEDRLSHALEPGQEGICSHVVLDDARMRTMTWYVSDAGRALEQVRLAAQALGLSGLSTRVDFDPAWLDYLRWAD